MTDLWGDPRLETDDDALVLVAVLTSPRDLAIAREQGWYRIPVKRAPRRIAADYLAFYQTRAFGEEAYAVSYYAPVRRFHVARRAELLPDEPDHPRAGEAYYQIEIGSLERLPRPIPSRRLRRITFIPTTLKLLLAAEEINDLWWRDEPQERLWAALREAGLLVEYRYRVGEPPDEVQVDFASVLPQRTHRRVMRRSANGQPDRLARTTTGRICACRRRLACSPLQPGGAGKTLPACLSAVLALVHRLGGQDA